MSKPIRPQDVGNEQTRVIPASVFDAFNTEIATRFSKGIAVVPQEAVVTRLVNSGLERKEIFDLGYLNVEEAYGEAGWNVLYEKPGYNESGSAIFTFKSI